MKLSHRIELLAELGHYLKKYLYTGRVKIGRSQTWATADNADKYLKLRHNKNYPWPMRLYFGYMGKKINRHHGELIGKTKAAHERRLKKSRMPHRVLILVDGGCASSCESFLAYARQSKKVKLMGQNSAGISDYGNLHRMPMPCGLWELAYPTSRDVAVGQGQGIDNIGFPPDFRLEGKDTDWVKAALEKARNGW